MTDQTQVQKAPPTWLRQVVDFGALAAFLATFLFFRFARSLPGSEALVQATWGLVAGAALAIIVGLFVEKRLALMPLIVGVFALVFGVLTLVFHNDIFIKIKVTALNASLAIILLGGVWLKRQPLKALLGQVIPVNDTAWRTLTVRYGFFFAGVAVANELVRSEALVSWVAGRLGLDQVDPADVWVSFRGVLWIASSVVGLANIPLILKNLVSDKPMDATAPIEPEIIP